MKIAYFASFCTALTLVACGESTKPQETADAAPPSPDAASNVGDLPVPAQGFQIVSPFIDITAGSEVTYKYVTRYKGPTVGVKKWQSKMTQGSHHMIVYFLSGNQTEETVTEGGCTDGVRNPTELPVWTYSSQTPDGDAVMPTGVGMTVTTNQLVCVEMHYLNVSDATIKARVTLNGEAYGASEQYQKAAAFVTYRRNFTLPANSNYSTGGSCAVDPAAKFFGLSTHVHKRGIKTEVKDGAAMLFSSENWEHPGQATWQAPFYSFTGTLDYRCDYRNDTNQPIREGSSANANEMCMAVGYFFPADQAKMCIDSLVIN